MKVLITGGTGVLGRALKKVFKESFFPTHEEMDITDPNSVSKVILDYKPDAVVHTAAFVDVRGCEEGKEKAWKTNVEGTQNVVDALNKLNNNCYLMYISTACVFAGENERYYTEDDVPAPKNFYGITKLCGEIITRQYKNTCIIRTNFAPKEQWKYPKAFVDRFGTYLFSDDAAKGIYDVYKEKKKGIIHIVGEKRMSMYELAVLAGSKNLGKLRLGEYKGPPVTVDMSLSTKRWKKYKIS
jgi:dTDP-4-dehydrorhamnose reductase